MLGSRAGQKHVQFKCQEILLSKLGPGSSSPFPCGSGAHVGLHVESHWRGLPAAQGRVGYSRPGLGCGCPCIGIFLPRVRSQTLRR